MMLLISLLSMGCVATRITDVQADPKSASGPLRYLMVIGLGTSEATRAEFEEAVTEKLSSEGLKSVASKTLFASQKDITRDALRERAQTDGLDGLLVSRLVEIKKGSEYSLSRADSFMKWWEDVDSSSAAPVIAGETKTFIIETRLFDLATDKPIYTAVSESFAPRSQDQVISELVPLIVKDLEKRGMIVTK